MSLSYSKILAVMVVSIATILLFSCRKHEPEVVDENTPGDETLAPEYYAGGAATVFLTGPGAYSMIVPGVSGDVISAHEMGRNIFNQEFTPLGTSEFDGLGPLFINTSCVSCHEGNGRSHPPLSEVDYSSGLLMRFSMAGEGPNGEPVPVPGFGNQLQTRAIDGVQPEAQFLFLFNSQIVSYPDGSSVTLHDPYHSVLNAYSEMPADALFSMRLGSPVFGLGLLEAVSDADILSRVDESDNDGDYISGKPNFVWNVKSQQTELGRLGWKSSNATIEQQTASAFHDDMGITSDGFFPVEVGFGQTNCSTGFDANPDVSEQVIDQVSFFLRTLAVPAPRNLEDPQVVRGKELFLELNCDGCHTPQLTTGISVIPELSNQVIYPYTDLLLHDMGEILADGRPDFLASTNEWRTPPLWGIGLAKTVSPIAGFLHDGRAATIEEAILWHGGEAHWAKEYFKALPTEDRLALLAFLNAL